VSAVANRSEPVVVVGAGLAGLVAAGQVAAAGLPVIVVEGAPVVGGRLATRSLPQADRAGADDDGGPSARADLGAQFFTVRSDEFARLVDDLVAKGIVYEWCRGFNEEDGYPRYAVRGGMSALADHLATQLPAPAAEVRTGRLVEAVSAGGGGRGARSAGEPARWRVAGRGWEVFARAVLLTAPVPESLALLEPDPPAGLFDDEMLAGLRTITYHRVLAVAAELDRPSAIPPPGARQLGEGPFSFVADNVAKGLSRRPVVTLHAAHALSAERWDDDTDTLLADLLQQAGPWLGPAQVVQAQLERWRWSGPVTPWPDRYAEPAPGLLLAGDAFGGPKVEGAFLSGLAAGTRHAGAGEPQP
jgi:predicted NAD/FAD-dependent oxidoreductase